MRLHSGARSGHVIVTTRSGSTGTCTVTFQYIEPADEELATVSGVVRESRVWIDDPLPRNGAYAPQLAAYRQLAESGSSGTDGGGNGSVGTAPSRSATESAAAPEPAPVQHEDPIGVSSAGYRPTEQTAIGSRAFDAVRFLTEVHAKTTLSDLQRGIETLRSSISDRRNQQAQWIKENFDGFVRCDAALGKISRKSSDPVPGAGTHVAMLLQSMSKTLSDLDSAAETAFRPLLEYHQATDQLRFAAETLQQYRFFFGLAARLRDHIAGGSYETAVADYRQALTQFGDSEVPLFQRAMREVDCVAEQLRAILYEALGQSNLSDDVSECYFGCLRDMERAPDPAWKILRTLSGHVCEALDKVAERFRTGGQPGGATGDGEGEMNSLNAMRYMNHVQLMRYSRFRANAAGAQHGFNAAGPAYADRLDLPATDSQLQLALAIDPRNLDWRSQFIGGLASMLENRLPRLWRFAQAYFSGKLRRNGGARWTDAGKRPSDHGPNTGSVRSGPTKPRSDNDQAAARDAVARHETEQPGMSQGTYEGAVELVASIGLRFLQHVRSFLGRSMPPNAELQVEADEIVW